MAAAPTLRADPLSFQQRVAAQEAVERVYYTHQIGATLPFEEAVPREVIRRRVRRYLEESHQLKMTRGVQITSIMLDEELARITARTKLPDRLREVFQDFGDDPLLIREAFVRPVLVDRLLSLSDDSGSSSASSLVVDDVEPRSGGPPGGASTRPWCPGESDAWIPMSAAGAPAGRIWHTVIWTGTYMIVWGGYYVDSYSIIQLLDSGGRYDPLTDTWTSTTILGAPSPRGSHTAVWTGTHMVIWGGADENGDFMLNTGGRYDPVSDTWAPTSTVAAPTGRSGHSAIWTGNEMIVWGGADFFYLFNTGGRYDPVADTWRSTSTIDAPRHRTDHSGIWAGTAMIIWGGDVPGPFTNTGGRYNPGSDTWTATSEIGAPGGRAFHTSVFTGREMLVWGGRESDDYNVPYLNTGGRYDPESDTWSLTTTTGAPSGRWVHSAVWTGKEMIIWGGREDATVVNTGGRYDPERDSWSHTTIVGAPAARSRPMVIWTDRRMIVWGGGGVGLDTGGLYTPGSDLPPDVTNLRWMDDGFTVEWDACPGGVANYDVVCGELGGVGAIGNGSSEVCMANEHPDTQMADNSPAPPPGHGFYFLVRATTPYSMGSYGRGTSGQERTTDACP